ncbi:hypothetical protein [Motiliproteus sp. SC1-56]|uniref:hypothetical protein n=1 Tax=Motiliproteus sp. SC1-56 TaxID=2799565 RepID=UPI001A8DB650|nr:hypothetical protein [Motiliproteus sp. SC1-56]
MTKSEIVGWRLDLVRNRLQWRGGAYLAAKKELFALIAKARYADIPVQVCLYTDLATWERHYQVWLLDEGIVLEKLGEAFQVQIIESCLSVGRLADPCSAGSGYLKQWLALAEETIDKVYDAHPEFYPDWQPDWVDRHQLSPYDGIVAIWSDKVAAEVVSVS